MQRERRALDFEQHAGVPADHVFEHMLHAQEPLVVEADALHVAVRIAPLGAVQAGDRQVGHREIRVDAVDAASRHHRDRAVGRASERIRSSGTRRGTTMPSGVGASSTSVPSKSKKKAVSARDRVREELASVVAFQPETTGKVCAYYRERRRFRESKASARQAQGRRIQTCGISSSSWISEIGSKPNAP